MSKTLKICGIEKVYLDYLRQFDHLVSKDPLKTGNLLALYWKLTAFPISLHYRPLNQNMST
ncbi:hypothetical protein GCM10010913_01830 [Paenibacillus aceti]|uniref:Uncharacterized protein n=1 Tax=Paenibacillus aceti TaxID=1820010 RepID=A0ABQ1VPE2_9BACL|nr:hypothetical protein GCM10010913_01830 [Paenibacillus aceti]